MSVAPTALTAAANYLFLTRAYIAKQSARFLILDKGSGGNGNANVLTVLTVHFTAHTVLSVFRNILPHAILIISLMLLTFFVIDLFNDSMAFLNNSITKILVAVLSLLGATLAVLTIIDSSHNNPTDLEGENHEI